ncbi:MAG: glutaredoxin family protein [Bermanella sp.]
MKKLIFMLIFFALLIWKFMADTISPYPDFAAAHNGKVILYATSWCGYCEKARKFLKKHQVAYFEYDIEESVEGKRQQNVLGGEAVPLLLINGQVIKGYNPKEILNSLK